MGKQLPCGGMLVAAAVFASICLGMVSEDCWRWIGLVVFMVRVEGWWLASVKNCEFQLIIVRCGKNLAAGNLCILLSDFCIYPKKGRLSTCRYIEMMEDLWLISYQMIRHLLCAETVAFELCWGIDQADNYCLQIQLQIANLHPICDVICILQSFLPTNRVLQSLNCVPWFVDSTNCSHLLNRGTQLAIPQFPTKWRGWNLANSSNNVQNLYMYRFCTVFFLIRNWSWPHFGH